MKKPLNVSVSFHADSGMTIERIAEELVGATVKDEDGVLIGTVKNCWVSKVQPNEEEIVFETILEMA